MSQSHPLPPPAQPQNGLLADLRALLQACCAQHRADPAGMLAATHALILALLTQLIALIEALPAAPHTDPAALRPARAWRRAAHRGMRCAPEVAQRVRILHVIGPGPHLGMRPLARSVAAPRLVPPIRPPPSSRPAMAPPRHCGPQQARPQHVLNIPKTQ